VVKARRPNTWHNTHNARSRVFITGRKSGAMHYDQSWMAYGWMGGLEAGAISAVVAALLFALVHWRRHPRWSYGLQLGVAWLLALALTASGDMWNMFYFNFARLQSLQLLKMKLAAVHDPDGISARVLCELLGALLGVFIALALCDWRQRSGGKREP
jgi:hypothetical protein